MKKPTLFTLTSIFLSASICSFKHHLNPKFGTYFFMVPQDFSGRAEVYFGCETKRKVFVVRETAYVTHNKEKVKLKSGYKEDKHFVFAHVTPSGDPGGNTKMEDIGERIDSFSVETMENEACDCKVSFFVRSK